MIRYTIEMDVDTDGVKTWSVVKYVSQGAGLVPVCVVRRFQIWKEALKYQVELSNIEVGKEMGYHE